MSMRGLRACCPSTMCEARRDNKHYIALCGCAEVTIRRSMSAPVKRVSELAEPSPSAGRQLLSDAAYLRALGKRVREGREQRGMARKVLAESSGVSERYLAQLESGTGNASVTLLRRVAAAL